MAGPAGLEPAALRLEVGCSIQLSYGPGVTSRMSLALTGIARDLAGAPAGTDMCIGARGWVRTTDSLGFNQELYR